MPQPPASSASSGFTWMEISETKVKEDALLGKKNCENCGAEAISSYCQECGQRYESHLHPFRGLITEIASSLFNVDNRLLQTLKLLLKPGRLTKAYLAGRRIRYISPFRLYLICSVIYFAIASWLGVVDLLFITMNNAEQVEGLAEALPKLMFVIVPGFALLLKGLYRNWLYAEHLIFAFHVHAVWYLLFTFKVIIEKLSVLIAELGKWTFLGTFADTVSFLTEAAFPVFLFMAMRYVYQESRVKTFWKIFLLLLGYVLVVMVLLVIYVLVIVRPDEIG